MIREEELTQSISDRVSDIAIGYETDILSSYATMLHDITQGNALQGDFEAYPSIYTSTQEKLKIGASECVLEASELNDTHSAKFYEATGVIPTPQTDLIEQTQTLSYNKLEELIKTSAFKDQEGNLVPVRDMYLRLMLQGQYAVTQGDIDAQTYLWNLLSNLQKAGLYVVDYPTGYTMKLESAMRMNLLDAIRQFNIEYRRKQGIEFGADGVEISAHLRPAPDHMNIQGKRYSNEAYDKLNSRLERPIGTRNCMHSIFPIILDISTPTYTKEQLEDMKKTALKLYHYKSFSGKMKICNGYEATQLQRQWERRIKKEKEKLQIVKELSFSSMQEVEKNKLSEYLQYYVKLSDNLSLTPKFDRIRQI